ncbi:hypothetical protein RJ639_022321 [Escallonia herrerae]|uniref:Uncharacterized protein n=1 Tax=Escallonia herrerae TaxID=1293975 RepID=A0AA88V5H5_9ASTE|nr:hypothetical protein RJ639_022321 [Escallonia herrerae]
MTEGSPTTVAPLLLRNLLTSLFIYADKSLENLGEKYKLLQLLRYLLVTAFLFFLRLLPGFFSSLNPSKEYYGNPFKVPKAETPDVLALESAGGGSGIARALSQLLSIINDIPVTSRKYEVVRSLAERLIDENLQEGSETLREVNCTVLSAAFSRTLRQLEAKAAAVDQDLGLDEVVPDGTRNGDIHYLRRLNRVLRAVRHYGDAAWTRFGKPREGLSKTGSSAEKMSAELLWLAQKMAACGCVGEAVCRWASASRLAWLALSAEPRLQGSLVKVSGSPPFAAFLLRQAKDLEGENDQEGEESKIEQRRHAKLRMLTSWLPLLCRASNGTDSPVLSTSEKAGLERVLEEMIESLEDEEEQEKALSLWLHHFTHCPSSDWPNLYACYARWCTASRRLLLAPPPKM